LEKNYHDSFKEYTEYIVSHPNYNGLKYNRRKDGRIKWVTTKNTKIGKERINWALNKAKEFRVEEENAVYSKVMYKVHPTKETVCQICGEPMSIQYIYPNSHFKKRLEKDFDYIPNIFDSIHEINEYFKTIGMSEPKIIDYYYKSMNLKDINPAEYSLEELVKYIEYICRSGKKSTFGPGSMSNFPDRYDGYHSYNRCCRKREDTGRHDSNMRTYNKDRRAYQNWSDGNIHAANKFMNSSYFQDSSADHIGPISLGFVHDPRYLKKMDSGENSSKRDKLLYDDILELIRIEKNTKLPAASSFAAIIWQHLKNHLENSNYLLESYRNAFKDNILMFMEFLWLILDNCNDNAELFLDKFYFDKKAGYFQYDYEFNEDGNITDYRERNITDATKKEYDRFVRISINSVYDFHEKNNRLRTIAFSDEVNQLIEELINFINMDPTNLQAKRKFDEIIEQNQTNILKQYEL